LYVCICRAVTDDEVDGALDAGADSLAAVMAVTGAGSYCGMCHDRVEELITARCAACPLASRVA
jgi:bacterioferritin-associated ferredoxin